MRNNMRNNIYKLIIGGLMCLCLTGCQKAPEKVVEDMKEYGENEQKKGIRNHILQPSRIEKS